jgi:iron uptake system component EfeO
VSSSGSPEDSERQSGWIRSGRWIGALVVVAVVLVVVAVVRPHGSGSSTSSAAAFAPAHADSSVPGTSVEVGADVCGRGWTGGTAGPQTFALWDNSSLGVEVYLQNVDTGKVYFDAEGLGVNVTRSFTATIDPGRYRFYCLPSDSDGLPGPVVTVAGSYDGATTPGMSPVTDADLFGPIAQYHAWVTSRFPTLQRQVQALDADIRRGDVAAAKRDWLAGHMTYETLGAAYDAFGDDDAAINAMPSANVPAAKDPDLVGFHKIEALLWSGAPTARIAPYTGDLVKAVAKLRTDFKGERLQTIDIGLRSHEIMENAVQFVLNGYDDAGSHTSLATLDANLTGTLEAMKPIRSVLRTRDQDLAQTDRWIARSQRLVRSYDHHGVWTPLQSLSTHQREVLNATVSQTVELLSRIASITEPRGAPRQ